MDARLGELPAIGPNLKQLRVARRLTLEELAAKTGVSRAMLSQIELGQSAPTITVIGKIAPGLGVSIEELVNPAARTATIVIRKGSVRMLVGADGAYVARSLLPSGARLGFDFNELRLGPAPTVHTETPPARATVSLVVAVGRVELGCRDKSYVLEQGDGIQLEPGGPYSYRNLAGAETIIYVVTQHASKKD